MAIIGLIAGYLNWSQVSRLARGAARPGWADIPPFKGQ